MVRLWLSSDSGPKKAAQREERGQRRWRGGGSKVLGHLPAAPSPAALTHGEGTQAAMIFLSPRLLRGCVACVRHGDEPGSVYGAVAGKQS